MQRSVNRQAWLRSRPNGIPQAHDFDVRGARIPTLQDGEFLGGVGSAAGHSERGHRAPKPPGRRIRFHHTHHI
jgi:hypothetical protein